MIRPNDAGLLLGKHAIEERSMGAWVLGMMARREKVAFSKRVWDALEWLEEWSPVIVMERTDGSPSGHSW